MRFTSGFSVLSTGRPLLGPDGSERVGVSFGIRFIELATFAASVGR